MEKKKSYCKSCSKEIVWVKMEGTGHLMPINADSIKISVVLNDSETKGAIRKTGITHFSTCPKADHHRKKGV
tara:strand:- start:333 stop:548 length:216 start_codon:yes stop_codon:yes gene_type:complete